MITRTTRKTVTFTRPFSLSALDDAQPERVNDFETVRFCI
jgi:hypothetical protein